MTDIGMLIRSAYQSDTSAADREYAVDYFMYLWCGPDSPLFDKSKMATFERYFLKEKETHEEKKETTLFSVIMRLFRHYHACLWYY